MAFDFTNIVTAVAYDLDLVREPVRGRGTSAVTAGTLKVRSLASSFTKRATVLPIILRGAVAAGMGAFLVLEHSNLLTV